MTIEILMPSVGAGTTYGKIIQWHKQVGELVAVGDLLAEIETDKAVIDLEAFDEGELKEIVVPASDDEVASGEVVAILAPLSQVHEKGMTDKKNIEKPELTPESDSNVDLNDNIIEEQSTMHSHKKTEKTKLEQIRAANESSDRTTTVEIESDLLAPARRPYFASPSARRLARELEVDIVDVRGSGPKGRIVRADIERKAALRSMQKQTAGGFTEPIEHAGATNDFIKKIPHSTIRKTIARRLQESKQEVPHFYLTIDCEIDELLEVREHINKHHAQKNKISINDFLVFGVSRAVAQHPEINRYWSADGLIQNSSVDISVAVSTSEGLFTPVVRKAELKSLGNIAGEINVLIEKARTKRLLPIDYEGGSITISNLGMYGIKEFSAIINPPQSCILAIGAAREQVLVKNGQFAIANVMTITLSVDHRVIDGAVAAQFLAKVRQLIESPSLLLV